MDCCNCGLGPLEQPGVHYYGCEHFDVIGPWWVCDRCRIAAYAVLSFCAALPRAMKLWARRAEVEEAARTVGRALGPTNDAHDPPHDQCAWCALRRLAALALEESE